MSAAKLTPAQVAALASIAATGWWPKGSRSATRMSLLDLGLIHILRTDVMASGLYKVTDAGAAELMARGFDNRHED